MLVREIAARYLGEAGTIRVDADPRIVADIGRAGSVVDLTDGGEPVPGDVVLISVDPLAEDLSDRLGLVTARDVTVILLLPVAAGDLPVGRLTQAACAAPLAFVEIAPIEPGWSLRTVVVCQPSSRPVPVRPYLGDDDVVPDGTVLDSTDLDRTDRDSTDLDSQGLRIGWEWGLGDARARAVEQLESAASQRISELELELVQVRRDHENELMEVRQELVHAGQEIIAAREMAERSERRAVAEAQRRSALQQSSSFLVGRAVVTARRHPLRGGRQFVGAIRRSVRR